MNSYLLKNKEQINWFWSQISNCIKFSSRSAYVIYMQMIVNYLIRQTAAQRICWWVYRCIMHNYLLLIYVLLISLNQSGLQFWHFELYLKPMFKVNVIASSCFIQLLWVIIMFIVNTKKVIVVPTLLLSIPWITWLNNITLWYNSN